VVTGFVFHIMLAANAFTPVRGNLTMGVVNLIYLVNSLLMIKEAIDVCLCWGWIDAVSVQRIRHIADLDHARLTEMIRMRSSHIVMNADHSTSAICPITCARGSSSERAGICSRSGSLHNA
jgi:hypothetical protein